MSAQLAESLSLGRQEPPNGQILQQGPSPGGLSRWHDLRRLGASYSPIPSCLNCSLKVIDVSLTIHLLLRYRPTQAEPLGGIGVIWEYGYYLLQFPSSFRIVVQGIKPVKPVDVGLPQPY